MSDQSTALESDRLMAERTGLPENAVRKLREVLRKHPDVSRVTLYGSRALGSYRENSDIDLTLHGENLQHSHFLAIERDIDDLLLPWKTDLSIFHEIDNQELLGHITRVGIPFYSAC